jgi:SatD family protein
LFVTLFWVTIRKPTQNRFVMPSKKPLPLAVLMGDLVGSERARSIKTVHRAFNKAIDLANERYAEGIESPLTITLGDEFQGLLRTLSHAWRVASELRFRLLVADVSCRFVIGMTQLETPLNKREAWNMMGGGLAEARDKLNDKRTGNAYRFSLPGEPIVESLLDAVGDSLTEVEIGWTATQLEYYWAVHDGARSNAAVAKSLGVTSRSLYKVLSAARVEFHRRQSAILRGALTGLDERYGL